MTVEKGWTNPLENSEIDLSPEIQEPDPDQKTQKEPELDPEPEAEPEKEELGRRAEKRIKTLWRKQKDTERLVIERDSRIQELEKELENVRTHGARRDAGAASVLKTQLESKIKNLTDMHKKALTDGDVEAASAATQELIQANIDLRSATNWEAQAKANAEIPKKEDSKPKTPVSDPEKDLAIKEWISNHKEFWADRKNQRIAMALESALLEEGLDWTDPEFTEELDKRLTEMNLLKSNEEVEEELPRTKTRSLPQGGSSRAAPVKKKDAPTQADAYMARRLGVPLKDYMEEKVRISGEKDIHGYVKLDL